MKYWLVIFCLLFACTKPIIKEVNLIPKPQKLETSDGIFSLSFNTKLIVDSLFDAESDYLKTLLNLELKGNGNLRIVKCFIYGTRNNELGISQRLGIFKLVI